MRVPLPRVAVLALAAAAAPRAQDHSFCVPATELAFVDGTLADLEAWLAGSWFWLGAAAVDPVVVIDEPRGARAWLSYGRGDTDRWWFATLRDTEIAIAAPPGLPVVGRLSVLDADGRANSLRFRLPASLGSREPEAVRDRLRVERSHLGRLVQRGVVGTAWFRHRLDEIARELGDGDGAARQQAWRDPFDLSFDLFTGGRALAENLQLERTLEVPAEPGGAAVDLDTIEGITVRAFDWEGAVAGLGDIDVDPLAALVPADQHALLFPDADAALRVGRQADRAGAPVLQAFETRSLDEGTLVRYERQLGISLSDLPALHPRGTVALTGGDLSLRLGSDVAVLLHCGDEAAAAKLADALWDRIGGEGAEDDREHQGVRVRGCRGPTARRWVAAVGGAVVLANSPGQVRRVIDVARGAVPAMAAAAEYRFFRHRYRRGEVGESGFAMLTDAAIRRWCSPRWRIAESRRVRAAARLAALTADHADAIVGRQGGEVRVAEPLLAGCADDVRVDAAGVHSAAWGSLTFVTPAGELDLQRVHAEEAVAYQRFRERYQRAWSEWFDPIAIRLGLADGRAELDVSVFPLIEGSDYRRSTELMRGAAIQASALDPHPTLAHYAMAIDTSSRPFRMGQTFLSSLTDVAAKSWMGQTVAVWADPDPFWQLAFAAPDLEQFMEHNWHRLPLAAHVEVSNPLTVVAFLAALRASADELSPGLLAWRRIEHDGLSYTAIVPTERTRRDIGNDEAALYYAVSGGRLVLSLNEEVLRAALRRDRARRDGGDDPTAEQAALARLGRHMALRIEPDGVRALQAIGSIAGRRAMPGASWSNLWILDEWKRRYPDLDPVEVHQRLYGARPVCCGGGQYVWNAALGAVESSTYGHPAAPREGPALPLEVRRLQQAGFGITFEDDGLRARAVLLRN